MENHLIDGEIGVNNGTFQSAPLDSVEPNTEYRRGQEMLSTMADATEQEANKIGECKPEEKELSLGMTIGDQVVLHPDLCFDGDTLPFGWECSDYSVVNVNPTQSLGQAILQAMKEGEAKVTATSVYPELCQGSVSWNVTVKGVHDSETEKGEGSEEQNPQEPQEPEEPKSNEEVLANFIDALNSGSGKPLEANLTVVASVSPESPGKIDLGGNTITTETTSSSEPAILLEVPGTYTLTNGKIEQVSGAPAGIRINSANTNLTIEDMEITAGYPVFVNNESANVTIKSGTYTSPNSGGVAVYVLGGGKVTIEGGYYSAGGNETKYLVNLKDAIRKPTTDKDPIYFVEIKGGTFEGWDPSNNASEGAGTNYVPTGYIVGHYTKGGVTKYVVEKYANHPDMDIDGPEGEVITWDLDGYKKRNGIIDADKSTAGGSNVGEDQKPDLEID